LYFHIYFIKNIKKFHISKKNGYNKKLTFLVGKNLKEDKYVFLSTESYKMMTISNNPEYFISYPEEKEIIYKLLNLEVDEPNYKPKKIIREKKEITYYNITTKEKTQYPYRFKTEEEFIKEYGSNWKYKITLNNTYGYCWCNSMNYLLGQICEIKDMEVPKTTKLYELPTNVITRGFWYITPPMITLRQKSPSYAPKKIIRE